MTESQRTKAANAIKDWRTILSGVTAALVVLWWFGGDKVLTNVKNGLGLSAQAELLAQIAADVSSIKAQVADNRRRIDVLSFPTEVAEFHPASRINADCQRGEWCAFTIRVRRLDGAVDCRILPEASSRTITSYSNFTPVRAAIRSATGTVNVGGDFVELRGEVFIPADFPPGKFEYRSVSAYTDCPWQNEGQPPVTQAGPPLVGTILP